MSKYWRPQPLNNAILELLKRKQGTTMDGELYKALLEAYGEICPSDLNKALMKLEVDGLIRVYTLTRNKRRVELVEELKN